MKTNKKRIVLSALSLVLVFCLMAGGTMAWFTDTEKVAGNFSAGVLDIEVNPDEDGFTTKEPMEFKNLRPMLLKNFDKELVESGDVNNLENNGQDPDNYPQDNLPIYFRPVRVENKAHCRSISTWVWRQPEVTIRSRSSMETTSSISIRTRMGSRIVKTRLRRRSKFLSISR